MNRVEKNEMRTVDYENEGYINPDGSWAPAKGEYSCNVMTTDGRLIMGSGIIYTEQNPGGVFTSVIPSQEEVLLAAELHRKNT